MLASRFGATLAMFVAGAMTLAGAATMSADAQTNREQVPQIVHLDVYQSGDTLRARGVIYVPENTRVSVKYLTSHRNYWQTRPTVSPQSTGRNVHFEWTSGSLNSREWNGKTFTLTLMASSSAGAVTKSDRVVFRQGR